jgi:hypothetical protein
LTVPQIEQVFDDAYPLSTVVACPPSQSCLRRALRRMAEPHHRRNRHCTAPNQADLQQSLTTQARGVIACDFLTVDTVLLKRLYVPIFIENHPARCTSPGAATGPTSARATSYSAALVSGRT